MKKPRTERKARIRNRLHAAIALCAKNTARSLLLTTLGMMSNRRTRLAIEFLLLSICCIISERSFCQEPLYKQYLDPAGRFSFEYPATMKLEAANKDEVKVYHPAASCRISVFIEQRQGKSNLTADILLAVLKKRLQEEMKNVSVLGEGKLAGLKGSQGYIAVSFTDKKGTQLVQLVQYYVSEDRFLQMTISDRPEGFKNLETVIRKIHQSLKILNPKLK